MFGTITGRADKPEATCAYGTLVAEFFSQPGIYDGITVDFVRLDGARTQCAVVVTVDDGFEWKLCVLFWGSDDCAVHEQVVKSDGEYSLSLGIVGNATK